MATSLALTPNGIFLEAFFALNNDDVACGGAVVVARVIM